MSPEETRFWIVALTEANSVRVKDRPPAKLMDAVRSQRETFSKPITTKDTAELIGRGFYFGNPGAFNLLTPGNFLAVARDVWGLEEETPDNVLSWFHQHALPYLGDAEYRAMRDEVRASLRKIPLLTSYHHRHHLPLACHLGAALGLHEEIRRLVGSIPDEYYVSKRFCRGLSAIRSS